MQDSNVQSHEYVIAHGLKTGTTRRRLKKVTISTHQNNKIQKFEMKFPMEYYRFEIKAESFVIRRLRDKQPEEFEMEIIINDKQYLLNINLLKLRKT